MAQVHEQVCITIILLVQGRETRLLNQSDAILHGARFEAQRLTVAFHVQGLSPVACDYFCEGLAFAVS
jgi:hypothetical protein